MQLTIGKKIALVFSTAVVLFCLGGGITFLANNRQLASMERVQQTYDLLSHLHDIQADIFSLVSLGRAYLLTGAESYAQQYAKIELRLADKIKQVRQQHSERRVLDMLQATEARLNEIKQELQRLFQLRGRTDPDTLRLAIDQGVSQRLLDEIERLHDDLDEQEHQQLTQTEQQMRREISFTNALILVGIPGMAIILGLMAWFVSKSIIRPIQAMAKASTVMAGGDLDFSFQVSDRPDEIGTLQ